MDIAAVKESYMVVQSNGLHNEKRGINLRLFHVTQMVDIM